jgi:hypothetical protein
MPFSIKLLRYSILVHGATVDVFLGYEQSSRARVRLLSPAIPAWPPSVSRAKSNPQHHERIRRGNHPP